MPRALAAARITHSSRNLHCPTSRRSVVCTAQPASPCRHPLAQPPAIWPLSHDRPSCLPHPHPTPCTHPPGPARPTPLTYPTACSARPPRWCLSCAPPWSPSRPRRPPWSSSWRRRRRSRTGRRASRRAPRRRSWSSTRCERRGRGGPGGAGTGGVCVWRGGGGQREGRAGIAEGWCACVGTSGSRRALQETAPPLPPPPSSCAMHALHRCVRMWNAHQYCLYRHADQEGAVRQQPCRHPEAAGSTGLRARGVWQAPAHPCARLLLQASRALCHMCNRHGCERHLLRWLMTHVATAAGGGVKDGRRGSRCLVPARAAPLCRFLYIAAPAASVRPPVRSLPALSL